VRNLARNEMNDGECFRTRIRKQPQDQWSNYAGRISGVEVVRGSERDKREPDNERKVVTNKPAHSNLFCAFCAYNAAAPETTSMISFVIAA
jgi:hypothetical protein